MDIKEIRRLASQFSEEQLESCITQEMSTGENDCEITGGVSEVVDILSKAEYVRHLMDEGMSKGDAMREMARKIRNFQKEEKLLEASELKK